MKQGETYKDWERKDVYGVLLRSPREIGQWIVAGIYLLAATSKGT